MGRPAIASIEVGSNELAITAYHNDSGVITLSRPADGVEPVHADAAITARGYRRVNDWVNVGYSVCDDGVWYADVEATR